MLLKDIAKMVLAANHPEVYQIILLIDERPEEVTDMQNVMCVVKVWLLLLTKKQLETCSRGQISF